MRIDPLLNIKSSLTVAVALVILPTMFLLNGCNKIENRPKIKIGYMNYNNEQETTGRFLPMTRYLSDKTGVEFEFVPVDTNDFEKRFKEENSLSLIPTRFFTSFSRNIRISSCLLQKNGASSAPEPPEPLLPARGVASKNFPTLKTSGSHSDQCWRRPATWPSTT